jgi:hypothetical protein
MWQTKEYHYHGQISFGTGSSGGHSYFFPLLGFGAGAALFANGFWNYRKLRIIEDTPRVHIRSIPMGLVHVHGKVTGTSLLTSPVARIPCYYYRVQLEQWNEYGKHQGWRTVNTETDQRTFYVDDGTGKVLINPQSAEFDLPSTYWGAFGRHASGGPYLDPSLGMAAGPSEQELRAHAAKAYHPLIVGDQKSIAEREAKYAQAMESESFRITEYCLVAEHEYDLIGTCAENPQSQDDQDRNLILKGQNEPTFVISGFSELTLEKTLRKRAVTKIILGGSLMVISMGTIILFLVK